MNDSFSKELGYISNSAIANYLRSHKDNSGLCECQIGKDNSRQEYNVRFFISSQTIKKPSISYFEMAVMDAIISLYANNRYEFTLHSLIEFMFGQKKKICSPKFKTEIQNAIDKLCELDMAIDITEECEMRSIKPKKLRSNENIKDRIMSFDELKSSLRKKNSKELEELAESGENHLFLFGEILYCTPEKNKYLISEPPLLYLYAEYISHQIITYPLTLLKHSDDVKDTGQKFLLRYFLIIRIAQMKYHNFENSNTIVLYEPKKPSVGLVPKLFPEHEGTYIDFIRTPEFKRKIENICNDIRIILDDFIKNDSKDKPVLNINTYKKLYESNVIKYVIELNGSSADDATSDASSEEKPQ